MIPVRASAPSAAPITARPAGEWVDAGGDIHYAEQGEGLLRAEGVPRRRFAMKTRPAAPGPISSGTYRRRMPLPADRRRDRGKRPDRAYQQLRGVSGDILTAMSRCPTTTVSTGSTPVRRKRRVEYAEMGECFTLEGGAFVVASKRAGPREPVPAGLCGGGGDYQTFPDLIWVDDDGFENWCYPEDVVVSDTDDNVFICTYDLSPMEELYGGDLPALLRHG